MRFAVIDLGTNGFRLYVAESTEKGHFKIIHRQTSEFKLAAEGIHHIGPAPFRRGIDTLKSFSNTLQVFDIQQVRAFGTAALRLADNNIDFIETAKKETGIHIELISGEREAELIYKGIRLGVPLSATPVLMVDVGGGSVEFIICTASEVFWAKSYNIGIAILKQNFHTGDAILTEEIEQIEQALNKTCTELSTMIAQYKPEYPVIASATLDFWSKNRLREEVSTELRKEDIPMPTHFNFIWKEFDAFYRQLVYLSEKKLNTVHEVPPDQVEMFAVTLVLIRWIMSSLLNAEKLVASSQSMKAGILYEMSLEGTNPETAPIECIL